MTSSVKTRLENRLAKHEAILENLYVTMEEASSSLYARTELDTNEGRQEITEKRIDRIQQSIDKEEAIIDSINSKLRRTGIVALNNRRR